MARTRDGISLQSLRFSDDYEVYVDYGKGRPVKMKETEANFIDVEQFLTGCCDSSKKRTNKNCNDAVRAHRSSAGDNDDTHGWTTRRKPCIPHKSSDYSHRDSSTIFRKGSTIIHDETWFSNKSSNSRVAAFNDPLQTKMDPKIKQASFEPHSSRAITYKRTSSKGTERKLFLNIAVNGASKSMRGHVPISNLDLQNGDFGDDAGLFTENRHFSFVGLADGASGNRLLGINPADFSQAILSACQHIFHQNHIPSNQLSRLLKSAIQQVQINKIRGSSTLCLLALDKQEHRLTTLNIGDSGFVIYRNNQLYHRSKCTMQSDGCGPKQLFALESSFNLPCFLDEKEILRDCSLDNIQVQKNDIIILSSDGLWDVMKSKQLQKIIEQNQTNDLQNLADDLFSQAVDGYVVNNRDDILIIVCRVEES